MDKFPGALRAIGFSLCIWYVVYLLYVTASEWAVTGLRTSGIRAFPICGGMMAVVEGEVVVAEKDLTVIEYYFLWDGTDYRKVIHCGNADYPLKKKTPVIYGIGSGIGSCAAVGFYRKPMRALGAAGAVMLLFGIALNLRKKGMRKNGKKKDYCRQLEDEYDSQRSRKAVR